MVPRQPQLTLHSSMPYQREDLDRFRFPLHAVASRQSRRHSTKGCTEDCLRVMWPGHSSKLVFTVVSVDHYEATV
ncbi:hypothetical protein TNIN_458191 [Trichonephila inaurata madagascariensis]|uniref:Uncharacterized protein n=1 Tax=Trichonephila inaurata madagascariensis TaxID=2747483 RepID=A0A8X7CF76_9ARAC|nr:hypothetical protein TNIN_458191 [Trichonephila inaurata madagascariensis]